MDQGRFKYCGPFHAPTIRQLFPNASVPDGPAGGARSGQAAQASNDMFAVGPVAPGKAASTYGALHAQAVAAAWWHQASRGLDGLLRTTAFLTTPADGSVFDAGNHLQHDV